MVKQIIAIKFSNRVFLSMTRYSSGCVKKAHRSHYGPTFYNSLGQQIHLNETGSESEEQEETQRYTILGLLH